MDNDAFEALFREHYASLATFALRYLREPSSSPGSSDRSLLARSPHGKSAVASRNPRA
jgi:hypothetical protein